MKLASTIKMPTDAYSICEVRGREGHRTKMDSAKNGGRKERRGERIKTSKR